LNRRRLTWIVRSNGRHHFVTLKRDINPNPNLGSHVLSSSNAGASVRPRPLRRTIRGLGARPCASHTKSSRVPLLVVIIVITIILASLTLSSVYTPECCPTVVDDARAARAAPPSLAHAIADAADTGGTRISTGGSPRALDALAPLARDPA